MSQDLLNAAKRAVEKAAQQYDKRPNSKTEIEYLKARNHMLAIRNEIKDNQLRDKDRKIVQLQSTLRITSDRQMEDKGFQSIGELAGQIAYRLTPKEQAEALFKEAGE